MKGGVRKRSNKWYYYFDLGIVEGKRKKVERDWEASCTIDGEQFCSKYWIESENSIPWKETLLN